MKKFCNGASVVGFGRPKTTFTFGMNSCANEAGMTKSLKRSNGGKKKPGWLHRSEIETMFAIHRRRRRALAVRTIISNRRNACRYNANVLLGQGVDSFRETEIELGQAAFAVGRKNQAHLCCSGCRYPDGALRLPPLRPPHSRNRSHRQNHRTQKCARCASSPAPIPGSF